MDNIIDISKTPWIENHFLYTTGKKIELLPLCKIHQAIGECRDRRIQSQLSIQYRTTKITSTIIRNMINASD